LIVEDLAAVKHFYEKFFQLPVTFEDDDSAVFRFGDILVNPLKVSAAPELISPANVASPSCGLRFS